jgi:hypothetical protein
LTDVMAVTVPAGAVTVALTPNVPGIAYVCIFTAIGAGGGGLGSVGVPSPQFHDTDVIVDVRADPSAPVMVT